MPGEGQAVTILKDGRMVLNPLRRDRIRRHWVIGRCGKAVLRSKAT